MKKAAQLRRKEPWSSAASPSTQTPGCPAARPLYTCWCGLADKQHHLQGLLALRLNLETKLSFPCRRAEITTSMTCWSLARKRAARRCSSGGAG